MSCARPASPRRACSTSPPSAGAASRPRSWPSSGRGGWEPAKLALPGGGTPPPAAPPFPFLEPPAEEEREGVALWERGRNRLRDKRHGLVASLRRLDGRSFREINAWLNRETGVVRVEDASLAQLERSIDLLLGELDRRSGAGRS